MKLNPRVREALNKIDFVNRFKKLSNEYPYIKDKSFETYSNDEVHRIITDLGYKNNFSKKENFFAVIQNENDFEFTFNISLKYGLVELIWGIKKGDERLTIGGPWGMICDLLGDDTNIKNPSFKNYDELVNILKKAFKTYEDFKKEIFIQNI